MTAATPLSPGAGFAHRLVVRRTALAAAGGLRLARSVLERRQPSLVLTAATRLARGRSIGARLLGRSEALSVRPPGMSDFAVQWLFGASAPEGVPIDDGTLAELSEPSERPAFLRELDDHRRLAQEAESERRSQPVPRGQVEEVPRSFRLSGRPAQPRQAAHELHRDPAVDATPETMRAAVLPALVPPAVDVPSPAAETIPSTPAMEVEPPPAEPAPEPESEHEHESQPEPERAGAGEAVPPPVDAPAPLPRAALVPTQAPRVTAERPRLRLSRVSLPTEPPRAPERPLVPEAQAAAEPEAPARGFAHRVRELLRVSKRERERAPVLRAATVELPSPAVLGEPRPEAPEVFPEPAVPDAESSVPVSPAPNVRVLAAPSEEPRSATPPWPAPELSDRKPELPAPPVVVAARVLSRASTPATPVFEPVPIEAADDSPRGSALVQAWEPDDDEPPEVQVPSESAQPQPARGRRLPALRPLLRAARIDRRREQRSAPITKSTRTASAGEESVPLLPPEHGPTSLPRTPGRRAVEPAPSLPKLVLRSPDGGSRRAPRWSHEAEAATGLEAPIRSAPTSGSRLAELSGGGFSVSADGVETVSFPWSQPDGAAVTTATLFRAADATEQVEAATAPTAAVPAMPAHAAPAPPSHPAAPQIEEIYEHVVERLRRDLLVERERMGDLLGDLP